ncbi:MAG: hypothetical protein WCO29_03630 [Nostocales cyanobacterium ELA583]|jgi:hypothetical protein
MNLHSEVILNLALTSLIGLWLIWQAIKINSNIDIFQIVVNWFRNRPIILPSLVFLIFPFLFAYIFQDLPPDFNQIFDNKILVQVLTTFGAVISIYIGNRALESFRKIQEEKKVARILIASIEGHLDYLRQINRELNGTILSKSQMENIENTINQIRKDYIYESALKSIGVLNIQYIDFISTYSRNLNCLLDTILNSYEQSFEMTTRDDKSNRYIPLSQLGILRIKIKRVSSDGEQCINKINIEVLNK